MFWLIVILITRLYIYRKKQEQVLTFSQHKTWFSKHTNMINVNDIFVKGQYNKWEGIRQKVSYKGCKIQFINQLIILKRLLSLWISLSQNLHVSNLIPIIKWSTLVSYKYDAIFVIINFFFDVVGVANFWQ